VIAATGPAGVCVRIIEYFPIRVSVCRSFIELHGCLTQDLRSSLGVLAVSR
jgi:hypothetical protein